MIRFPNLPQIFPWTTSTLLTPEQKAEREKASPVRRSLRRAGQVMKSQLMRSQREKSTSVAVNSNQLLSALPPKEVLEAAYRAANKFCLDVTEFKLSARLWQRKPAAELAALKQFIVAPAKNPTADSGTFDSLRSGVTFLQLIDQCQHAFDPAVVNWATHLLDLTLITTQNGKEFLFRSVASSGPLGVDGIDEMYLSLADRERVQQRLTTAWTDLEYLCRIVLNGQLPSGTPLTPTAPLIVENRTAAYLTQAEHVQLQTGEKTVDDIRRLIDGRAADSSRR